MNKLHIRSKAQLSCVRCLIVTLNLLIVRERRELSVMRKNDVYHDAGGKMCDVEIFFMHDIMLLKYVSV